MHSRDNGLVKASSIFLVRLILGWWVLLLLVDPVTSFCVQPGTQRDCSTFNVVQQQQPQQQPHHINMVSLHGRVSLSSVRRSSVIGRVVVGGGMHHTVGERPPDPKSILSDAAALQEKVEMLVDWWSEKRSVLCITGAGLSTESGIPDYRGNNGSYFRGHKPMIHQQFMESDYQRKRYWGRAMIGWKGFDQAQPNVGHMALAQLEQMGRLGVPVEDRLEFYESQEQDEFYSSSGQQQVSIVTQNVDSLHQRAGSKQVIRLHGAGDLVKCMNCGHVQNRNDFHTHLEQVNHDWLVHVQQGMDEHQLLSSSSDKDDDHQNKNAMRPDGDAALREDVVDYHHVQVPPCPKCRVGFFKPDVVFFGDTVPKHRVALCTHAVEAAEGLLVVGTSLAVHSAYRHVRAASSRGIPVAILNVGETRAEAEGLQHLLKLEAPAGDVLAGCVPQLGRLVERQGQRY